MTINATELRTLCDRYEAHIDTIEGRAGLRDASQFALRPGQIVLAREFLSFFKEPDAKGQSKNYGYFVRPTGTGKTVSLIDLIIGVNTLPSGKSVLGDESRGKRTLVMVPQKFLLDQWENELLGEPNKEGGRLPSKWGDVIRSEHVGIYRAGDSFEKKREALKKPVVVVTYDSARIITNGHDAQDIKEETETEREQLKRLLKPQDFSLTLLDEVHDRPRGDVTGAFIKEHFFGKSLIIGATATHLYKSGKTIGDYLFDGQIPFHQTTFRDAVNNREICPMRNVIAEVTLSPEQEGELRKITEAALGRARAKGATDRELDYTEAELERIVEISKHDQAAINLLLNGRDSTTGKRYKDMKQVWYCASVNHAKVLAEKLNAAMHDEGFATAVDGEMGRDEQNAILINYKAAKSGKALTNCQLLTLGFDDPTAELCVQLVPTRSPTRSMQQAGRVMRNDKTNRNKIANVVTFVYPGIEQVIFGELAQGMEIIPEGYEFTKTDSSSTGPSVRIWPKIEGLKVYSNKEELTLFAKQRETQRYIKGLPVKSDDVYTVEEMARELFAGKKGDALASEIKRLQERVFKPLEDAYDMRQQRQKFVGATPGEEDRSEAVTAFGQRFPIWRIGHYNHNGKPCFVVHKEAAALCRHALHGRARRYTPDLLSEDLAKQLSGLGADRWSETIDRVKDAYLDRKAYEHVLTFEDPGDRSRIIAIPQEMVGYYRKESGSVIPSMQPVDFYLKPDALLPVYRLATGADAKAAQHWWDTHAQLPRLKTAEWLNREDVIEALGMGALDSRLGSLNALWQQIEQSHRRKGPSVAIGQTKNTSVHLGGRHSDVMPTANKVTLSDGQQHICVHKDVLNMIRYALGMETSYEPGARGHGPRRA